MLKSTTKPTTKTTTAINLPDPDDFPGRQVVIWDGMCNFCRSQVQRLYRLDWTGQLSFISLHDQRVAQRYPELSFEQLMEQMWVISPQDAVAAQQRCGGADAIRYLSRRMPALYLVAPVMHLPLTMPLWRAIYRWIARRRYRLAGKDCTGGTCNLHK